MTSDEAATLARIEERQISLSEKMDAVHSRLDRYSNRIQALERWRAYLGGAIALLSIVLARIKGLWL